MARRHHWQQSATTGKKSFRSGKVPFRAGKGAGTTGKLPFCGGKGAGTAGKLSFRGGKEYFRAGKRGLRGGKSGFRAGKDVETAGAGKTAVVSGPGRPAKTPASTFQVVLESQLNWGFFIKSLSNECFSLKNQKKKLDLCIDKGYLKTVSLPYSLRELISLVPTNRVYTGLLPLL